MQPFLQTSTQANGTVHLAAHSGLEQYNPRPSRQVSPQGPHPRQIRAPIVCQRAGDARRYNRPTADEVVAILPGDTTNSPGNRDIIIQLHNNRLYQVSTLHQAYFPLCYLLLFLQREDGYHLELTRNDPQPLEPETSYNMS